MGRLRDERGAVVTVWAVLSITVMTLIVGIAVDLAGQINTKRLAGDVAAQAARTAGQEVNLDDYRSTGSSSSPALAAAKARAAALDYIAAAGMTGSARIEGADLVVETRATYRPLFLSTLGVGDLQVTGVARTRSVRVWNGEER